MLKACARLYQIVITANAIGCSLAICEAGTRHDRPSICLSKQSNDKGQLHPSAKALVQNASGYACCHPKV